MGTKTATNYFRTKLTAIRYYAVYGLSWMEVQQKINNGDIKIGEPPYDKSFQRIVLVDDGTKWAIEDYDRQVNETYRYFD